MCLAEGLPLRRGVFSTPLVLSSLPYSVSSAGDAVVVETVVVDSAFCGESWLSGVLRGDLKAAWSLDNEACVLCLRRGGLNDGVLLTALAGVFLVCAAVLGVESTGAAEEPSFMLQQL